MELPDFHIDHQEKIDWMIETKGWASEAVPARPELDPPGPTYTYTIGVPDAVGFTEVVVFGLAPAAANGLLQLVVDACRGGTDIPLGVELVGLLDNELRCVFAPVDLDEHGRWFTTAFAWYDGRPFEMTQLLFPDRNGFLPYETGYDQRLRFAQPVVGAI